MEQDLCRLSFHPSCISTQSVSEIFLLSSRSTILAFSLISQSRQYNTNVFSSEKSSINWYRASSTPLKAILFSFSESLCCCSRESSLREKECSDWKFIAKLRIYLIAIIGGRISGCGLVEFLECKNSEWRSSILTVFFADLTPAGVRWTTIVMQ